MFSALISLEYCLTLLLVVLLFLHHWGLKHINVIVMPAWHKVLLWLLVVVGLVLVVVLWCRGSPGVVLLLSWGWWVPHQTGSLVH